MGSKVFDQDKLQNLSPVNRALFSKFGRGNIAKNPFKCIHHAFEAHARDQPNVVAVEEFKHKTTYAELDRQANCLALRLRTMGVVPGGRVGLLVEGSIFMVVGILGILKAGAAYIPLDGNVVSNSTLLHALRNSGSSIVLAQRKFVDRIGMVPSLCLEESICHHSFTAHCVKPEDLSTPDDSAYIIYISGTKGVPKGVDVMHRNVTNLVCTSPGNLGLGPGLRISQLMNISFDMAAWEILASLCNGSTLCLMGQSSNKWNTVMKTVDVIIATPSMLSPQDPIDYLNIKVVAVAGEPCPKALAESWAETVQFYNCCGPTETTIVNTMQLYTPGKNIGIGSPTANNTVYILDDNMVPVKIGDVGVMWAGGGGVSRGYLNLPQQTAERYKNDPFLNDGSLMFNTGDIGRWYSNGTLEYFGRIDDQVKVKGFRVELDGVASAMEFCPGVTAAVALLIEDDLWGFVRPSTIRVEAVKAATSRVQPYYAVPARFICLDHFPEKINGKIDKQALRQMALELIEAERAPIATPAFLNNNFLEGKEILNGYSTAPIPVLARQVEGPQLPKKNPKRGRGYPPAKSTLPPLPHAQPTRTSMDTVTSTYAETLVGLPLDKEIEASSLEDQTSIWADYEQEVIPRKKAGRFMRTILSLYRRFFSIALLTNLGIFISVAIKGSNAAELEKIMIGNLFVAIAIRQEYVINAFFTIFTSIPSTWPMSLRRIAARVYYIGDLHSGAGMAAALWFILLTAQATKEFIRGGEVSVPTVTVTYGILTVLIVTIILAFQKLRIKFHDSFGVTHRLLAWTITASLWAQSILLAQDYKAPGDTLGDALLRSAPFWLLSLMTFSMMLPWLRLREVGVRSERLSSQAMRMYFDYDTPTKGSSVQLSDSPLTQWRSFSTIPEPENGGFSIIVSRSDGWTATQLANPSTKIWKRGIPTGNIMRIAPMFRRIVLVATGVGIGPCASAIFNQRLQARVLWISPDAREIFGDKFVDTIISASPDAVIHNTKTNGKPDIVKLTYRLVKKFEAEAVIVLSNQWVTEDVVYGMMNSGIPAFGAIWDS